MQLGIDLGGTKVAFALASEQGEIIARRRRPTAPSGDPGKDVANLVAELNDLLEEAGVAPAEISALGVSVPGPIDPERGVVLNPPNLPGWKEVPIRDWLARAFDAPVHIENDANAAALAEWRFGAGQGYQDVVYLTMSTGVGGGMILAGRLHRGHDGTAGEFGHVPIVWQGELCHCGMRGCLEAYTGGRAWAERVARTAPPDWTALLQAGSREALTAKHIVEAALAGDAHALEVVKRWNAYVARAIVQLSFGLAPQAIILGTIAVALGEELCFAPLRELALSRCWPHQARSLQILPATLRDELPYRAGLCAIRKPSGEEAR